MKDFRYPYLEFTEDWQLEELSKKGPPSWPDTCPSAVKGLAALVNRRATEQAIQQFFENFPFMLPGIDSFHHGPYDGIVVTKFPLGNDFQTDFAFVTSNSQTLCFTCIEIESPRKCLFRKDGKFHRDYIDAKQQIVDWLFWARHNIRLALDEWGPLFKRFRLKDYDIRFRGILVFGRRSHFEGDPKKQQRWSAESASSHEWLITMTYDRVIEVKRAFGYPLRHIFGNNRLAVCSYKGRKFQVKNVCA
jgi:hypothetical protein